MGISPPAFYPNLLLDIQTLKPFFTGNEEMHYVNQMPLFSPKAEPYMGRWQISWILLTTPFRVVLYVFLKAIASVLNYFNVLSLSRRIKLQANYVLYPFEAACNQLYYGKRLLISLINDYKKNLIDLYTLPSIPRENLPKDIEKYLHPKLHKVRFNLFGKLCHGSICWFNYLFLKGLQDSKLKDTCNSFVSYTKAITKLFEEGQPWQAAILQAMYGFEKVLLPVEEKIYKISSKDFEEIFPILPNGLYRFDIPPHSVSYIKFGNEEMIMDPSEGLILIEKPEQLLTSTFSLIKNSTEKDIYLAWQSLREENISFYLKLYERIRSLFNV